MKDIQIKASNHFWVFARLCRWHQPRGIALLCWPVWTVLWLQQASIMLWCIFTLGAVAMRTLGCLINDWCDQDIDAKVWRTSERPLASGGASFSMWLCGLVGSAILALVCLLLLPVICWYMALIILPLVVIYPTAKRWCSLPQLILAAVFVMGIPMAYLATLGEVNITCGLMMAIHYCWIFAYDTQYALADLPDDLGLNIFSSAKTLGRLTQPVIDGCTSMVLVLLMVLMVQQDVSYGAWLFWLVLGMGFWQARQWTMSNHPKLALKAFLWNNPLNALVFFMWCLCA